MTLVAAVIETGHSLYAIGIKSDRQIIIPFNPYCICLPEYLMYFPFGGAYNHNIALSVTVVESRYSGYGAAREGDWQIVMAFYPYCICLPEYLMYFSGSGSHNYNMTLSILVVKPGWSNNCFLSERYG